ncbi:MAG: DUF2892 domain-containing protein [Tenericutes bacterium]|nr:DUF2892 domain-containing protein [Mycoplasmatota bacterium]
MKYNENVGTFDQYIRYFLAIVFLVLSFVFNLWFFVGTIIMFVTGYFKFSGFYKLIGISTCKIKESSEEDVD